MTTEMILAALQEVKDKSLTFGRSWMMSNGKRLEVVTSEDEVWRLKVTEDFWVAEIWEYGHRVEA